MKVYLAARFRDRAWLKTDIIPQLQEIGIEVTSRWINYLDNPDNEHTYVAVNSEELSAAEKRTKRGEWSRIDLDDIEDADLLIAFTRPSREEGSPTRGGRHFEAGYAYGLGLPVIAVGPSEHNFYDLPDINMFETWNDCFQSLRASIIFNAASI